MVKPTDTDMTGCPVIAKGIADLLAAGALFLG
jgi:hypothetical protein